MAENDALGKRLSIDEDSITLDDDVLVVVGAKVDPLVVLDVLHLKSHRDVLELAAELAAFVVGLAEVAPTIGSPAGLHQSILDNFARSDLGGGGLTRHLRKSPVVSDGAIVTGLDEDVHNYFVTECNILSGTFRLHLPREDESWSRRSLPRS